MFPSDQAVEAIFTKDVDKDVICATASLHDVSDNGSNRVI